MPAIRTAGFSTGARHCAIPTALVGWLIAPTNLCAVSLAALAPENTEELWLIAVLVVIASVWFVMERLSHGNQSVLMLLAASISPLCSLVSWSHHFTWLVLAGVLLAAQRRWKLAALTWLALLARGHWPVPHTNGQELNWAWWQNIVGNDYVIVTALLVLCSLPLALRRTGAYQSAAEPMSNRG